MRKLLLITIMTFSALMFVVPISVQAATQELSVILFYDDPDEETMWLSEELSDIEISLWNSDVLLSTTAPAADGAVRFTFASETEVENLHIELINPDNLLVSIDVYGDFTLRNTIPSSYFEQGNENFYMLVLHFTSAEAVSEDLIEPDEEKLYEPIVMKAEYDIEETIVEPAILPVPAPEPFPIVEVIEAPALTPIIQPTNTATVTNAHFLNLRRGAGVSYNAFAVLTRGDTVTILGRSGGWVNVETAHGPGWVFGRYLDI